MYCFVAIPGIAKKNVFVLCLALRLSWFYNKYINHCLFVNNLRFYSTFGFPKGTSFKIENYPHSTKKNPMQHRLLIGFL